MAVKTAELILSIGSNCSQKDMVCRAKEQINKLLDGSARYSEEVWTEPVGIKSDLFLNCLCFGRTAFDCDTLRRRLKDIEHNCGRTDDERRRNIVRIDIDILRYGDRIMPKEDWNRDYIKKLLQDGE